MIRLRKSHIFILIAILTILIISYSGRKSDEIRVIDTGTFTIEVPGNWIYKKSRNYCYRSIIGRIVTRGLDFRVRLHFDYSESGVSYRLIPTLDEYLYQHYYLWKPLRAFHEPGVIYTSGSVDATKINIMKERGLPDTTGIRVEPIPRPEFIIKKKDSTEPYDGFYGVLTFRDSSITVDIDIPEKIKNHKFEIDTVNNYHRKIVYPKTENGYQTGVYFRDLNSSFTFSLVGENLSYENQKRAVKAFKTIRFFRDDNQQ